MTAFIKDRFSANRGGRSQFLELCCAKCNKTLFHYQKDGPGPLLRLYFDRIHAPAKFVGLQAKSIKVVKMIECSCGRLIAMPAVYKPEKRKSFRLFEGAVTKKRVRLDAKF